MKSIKNSLINPELFKSCLYCGSNATTVDHVPPKALLEKPYPPNLYTVPACQTCNNSFSKDEEYIKDAICHVGFTDILQDKLKNGSTHRALQRKEKYQKLFDKSHNHMNDGKIYFTPDKKRFEKVILKIAKGLFLTKYKRYPDNIKFSVRYIEHTKHIPLMLRQLTYKRRVFKEEGMWPEVGSRELEIAVTNTPSLLPWTSIQPEIFEFLLRPDPDDSKYNLLLINFHETVWALVQFNKP